MPRPTPYDRARLWVERMPAANSGQGGHNATFAVALALMQGFDLAKNEAAAILTEYNLRCVPPWSERELEHKLNQADKQSGYRSQDGVQPRGYLRDQGGADDREERPTADAPAPSRPAPEKPKYNREVLERVAGGWARTVDLVWLANRSALDPALVRPAKFLSTLYRPGEKVVAFTNDKTQGQALWPDEELPTTGKRGVWFLCQPVDGTSKPNPRGKPLPDGSWPLSRRIEECVTDWRFIVLESDEAPARLWLGALVQLPLRIAAIYTSGGRSVHALVRIDAPTKAAWDEQKHAMKTGLVILGADPAAMSAVRLTRLPGTFREGKDGEDAADGKPQYERYPEPALQKLLYLNPDPPLRPLNDLLAKRDVESDWLKMAEGIADCDEEASAAVRRGLAYYAKVSPRLRNALAVFNGEQPEAPAPPPEPPSRVRYVVKWIGDPANGISAGDESYLKQCWCEQPGTKRMVRKWDFDPGGPEVGEQFPTAEKALQTYEAAGIADRRYIEVVTIETKGRAR